MSADTHDIQYEGTGPSDWTLLTSALSSVIGAAKLLQRARDDNPAEAAANAKCAAMWCRFAAENVEAYLKQLEQH
jgi:hypothetical protein